MDMSRKKRALELLQIKNKWKMDNAIIERDRSLMAKNEKNNKYITAISDYEGCKEELKSKFNTRDKLNLYELNQLKRQLSHFERQLLSLREDCRVADNRYENDVERAFLIRKSINQIEKKQSKLACLNKVETLSEEWKEQEEVWISRWQHEE